MLKFIIACLATYRLTYMLNVENGPFDIFYKLRSFLGIVEFDKLPDQKQMEVLEELNLKSHELPPQYYAESFWGKLFSCFLCLSVWVAPVTFLLSKKEDKIINILAVSAGAIIIFNLTEE